MVERAQAGDTAAFVELLTWYQRRVISTAWRILGSQADALDAAQEVFLRLHRYLRSFRPGPGVLRLAVPPDRQRLPRHPRRRSSHLSFERERDRGALDHLRSPTTSRPARWCWRTSGWWRRRWRRCRRRSGPRWCCAISRVFHPAGGRDPGIVPPPCGRRSARPGPSCGRFATGHRVGREARRGPGAVSCAANETAAGAVGGRRPPAPAAAQLRRHLDGCADCRRRSELQRHATGCAGSGWRRGWRRSTGSCWLSRSSGSPGRCRGGVRRPGWWPAGGACASPRQPLGVDGGGRAGQPVRRWSAPRCRPGVGGALAGGRRPAPERQHRCRPAPRWRRRLTPASASRCRPGIPTSASSGLRPPDRALTCTSPVVVAAPAMAPARCRRRPGRSGPGEAATAAGDAGQGVQRQAPEPGDLVDALRPLSSGRPGRMFRERPVQHGHGARLPREPGGRRAGDQAPRRAHAASARRGGAIRVLLGSPRPGRGSTPPSWTRWSSSSARP